MSEHRKAIRAMIRSALEVTPEFLTFTAVSGWAQSVDADTLPVYGVLTPREVSSATDREAHERRVEVKLRITQMGDDLVEDDLDTSASAAERVLLPLLRAAYLNAEVMGTEMQLSGEGKARVGTIEITFAVLLHTDFPV